MNQKPVINTDDLELRENGNGGNFAARVAPFAAKIGAQGMGAMLHVVEPGKKAFPFHAHHRIEEMFYIIEGTGTYRFGGKEYPVKTGDVCAAPPGGPETAHQLLNTGKQTLKYLGFSTMKDTEVVEYPDSNKVAVISRFDWNNPQAGGIRHITRFGEPLDYWDGEE